MRHLPAAESSACARAASSGSRNTPRLIREHEQLAQMRHRPRALAASNHAEMGLKSIEIGQEDDARFVVLRGCREDVP